MNIDQGINVYNKDCMEVMKDYEDNYFDLAIVDPPYGIDVTKMNMGSRKTVKPDKNKDWDNCIPDENYFNELFRVSKNQIIWGGNYFKLDPARCWVIWDKGEAMYGRDFAEGEMAWTNFDKVVRFFKLSAMQLDRFHPTQKPVKLYSWLLQNYSSPEYKILDTHLGSGSHAIAWHYIQKGGEFVGCELDEDYFNLFLKRYKKETAQLTLF